MKIPKLVQIEAVPTKDGGHVLYALDEDGNAWAYEGAQRSWLALGTERLAPSRTSDAATGGHRE